MPIELSPSRVLPPSDKPPPESLRSSTPAGGGRIVKQSGGWSRNPPSKNPSPDRYIWTDSSIAGGDGLPFIGGETERDGTYIINFFKCQPALNYTGFAHPKHPWQKPALGPEALATCEAMLDVTGASGSPAGQTASAWTWPTASSNTTTTASLSPSAPGNTSSRESAPNSPRQRSLPNGGAPMSRCRPASTWISLPRLALGRPSERVQHAAA